MNGDDKREGRTTPLLRWSRTAPLLALVVVFLILVVLSVTQPSMAELAAERRSMVKSGDRSEMTTVPWSVVREERPAAGEALEFETSLRLRRTAQDVVVAVYDTNSGELFSASSTVVPAT